MTCRPQFQGASVLEVGLKMIEISSNDATRRMIMGLWKREEPRPNRHFMFPMFAGSSSNAAVQHRRRCAKSSRGLIILCTCGIHDVLLDVWFKKNGYFVIFYLFIYQVPWINMDLLPNEGPFQISRAAAFERHEPLRRAIKEAALVHSSGEGSWYGSTVIPSCLLVYIMCIHVYIYIY